MTQVAEDHPLTPLYRRLGFKIRRAQQIALSVFIEERGDIDVTSAQFGVMVAMKSCPLLDQISIARLVGLDRSTAGTVIGLLVDRGLVLREPHPTDRRKRLLGLSPEGEDLLVRLKPRSDIAAHRVMEQFTPSEALAFTGLLTRLVTHHSPHSNAPSLAPYVERLQGLYSRPGYLIRRAHQAATSLFEAECTPVDLTTTQFALLFAVSSCPGMDQVSASRHLGIDRSNVGLVVSILERRGALLRDPDPLDRRKRLLSLSSAGQDLLERAAPLIARVPALLTAPFHESETAALHSLLQRLLDHHNADVRVPLSHAE